MNRQYLVEQIRKKKSYLCVGLDTDPALIPPHLLGEADPIFTFNKAIIDATLDYCVAYKINTAFYESHGIEGWKALEKTVNYIPSTHFKIADAKRGDIGNTSAQYAKAFLQNLPFDSITIAPYMGADSVKPFLQYDGKWAIVLGLTSNSGASDFELQNMEDGKPLYEHVLSTVASWGSDNNIMFVVGATRSDEFLHIRKIIPHHFLLVPGVGAQGGNLEEISKKAMNNEIGLLVNVSRDIIYCSKENDYDKRAGEKAKDYARQMSKFL
ncbi:MAG: orotidine-5'-phosphate decarboxylase [Chitinophagia bacterium]|nr:orotidine-5'-phosphate decarboxylase [Chitinophagia bacterium]